MRRFIYILFGILFLGGISNLYAQSFKGTFEECKALAKKENKLILIDMYFVGCMPCAEMDKYVFPDSSIQKTLGKDFILFKTDVMKERDGKLLARKYGASGFPTFVVLNTEGKVILTESGYFSVPRLLALLEASLTLNKEGKYLVFDTVLEKDYPAPYSERYIKTGTNYSFSELEGFLDQQDDLFTEEAFLANSVTNFPKYNTWYYTHLEELRKRYGGQLMTRKVNTMGISKSKEYGQGQQLDSFKVMLDYIRPVYSDHSWNIFLPSYVKEYYNSSKDANTFLNLIEEYNLYSNWDLRSNAYTQVLVDQSAEKESLVYILADFLEARKTNKLDFPDQYKVAVLYYMLADFKRAEQELNVLSAMDYSSPLLNFRTSDMQYLTEVIRSKGKTTLLVKDVLKPIAVRFE